MINDDYYLDFNESTLDSFLQDFDPIIVKYFATIDNKKFKKLKSYSIANKYNKVFNPIDYTKKDNFSFIENLCMVYGFDQNKANKFLCRNRLVVDKFLNQFVHIKGISRLFNERYVEFEWDMHSRINFTDHKISYYRDHYFHQLRDCFMLYRLLEDQKIYNKVSSILHEPTASKISRYFSVTLDRLTYNIYEDQQLYNVFLCRKFELYWNDELLEKVTKHIADSGIAFDCKISKICNFIKSNVIDQLASFSQKGLIITDKEFAKKIARYVSLPEVYGNLLNELDQETYSVNEFISKLTEKLMDLNLECTDIRVYFMDNDNPLDISNKQNRRTIVKE